MGNLLNIGVRAVRFLLVQLNAMMYIGDRRSTKDKKRKFHDYLYF